MLLSSLSPDALNDLHLPAGALAALAAHTEWEYTPDSVEYGNEHADWCDDCDGWHRSWSVFGLRLDADGTLWNTLHTVDADGNWDLADETPYTLEDAAYTEDAAAAERSWQAYAARVAETGEDPLDNYWVAPREPATRITRWRVTFGEEGGKVVVREARRGTRSYTPAQLPAPVRAFLCLTGENEVEGFDSLDALRAQATEVRWIRGKPGVGEICVQMPTGASPASVRAAKRAAARRHLAETRA
jgi:hypothetical protein